MLSLFNLPPRRGRRAAARTVQGKRIYPTYEQLAARDVKHQAAIRRLRQADAHSKLVKAQPGKLMEGLNHLVLEVTEILRDVE